MTTTPIIVQAPPSKSVSHRAFIAAALSAGTSTVSGALESQDLTRTRQCMAACGANITGENGNYSITGMAGKPKGGADAPVVLNVGESGTTCRLLTAVIGAGQGLFEVRGEGRMHDRPIRELTAALEPLGPHTSFLEKHDCPPFVMRTKGLSGGETGISLEESSQYLSGLLLAAPMAAAPVTINVTGKKAVSWPYVAITLSVLDDFAVPFTVQTLTGAAFEDADWRSLTEIAPGKTRFLMRPAPYQARAYRVEGDWSNASYFLAAGALGPNPVTVRNLRKDSLQGDQAILDILFRMGADVAWRGDDVTVSPGLLRGLDLDMGDCPDLVPTVGAVAALAEGETTIHNVAHLRIKESDRLEAVASEARKAGAVVDVLDDGLRIEPGTPPKGKSIEFCTYNDHRLAMSCSLYALAGINVAYDNPSCVAKSFPGFFEEWKKVAG